MRYILFAFLIIPFFTQADGILLSFGQSNTTDENKAKKIAYVYEVEEPWDIFKKNNFFINWEASYFTWENKYYSKHDFKGGALTPLIGYKFPLLGQDFYIRVGIGVAYVDQVNKIPWGNRDLGDNWMFEDKIDLGVNIHKHHNISYSWTHYSNAGTNKHNDGVDIHSVNYTIKW